MAIVPARFWISEEWNFAILRALAMLGGMVALFLGPLRPAHQPHLVPLAWTFVAYKALLVLGIVAWSAELRLLLVGTVGLDLVFISLFVWFSGGLESHFHLLYYLLVALTAMHFGSKIALTAAGGAAILYGITSLMDAPRGDWHQLSPRVATLLLLAASLGYLSQRLRVARSEAEGLNQSLRENQARLETAYQALQAAQERLVQSERLATIGKMAAKVAHEVRNPLASVSLNAELLEDELRSLPEARRAEAATLLAAIRTQVDVLGAVTEEYLRFARFPKPKPEPTALGALIRDLAEFTRGELQARRIQLVLDVQDGLPTLPLDSGQIRQALLDLIRNAAEAMPKGGTLHIRTWVEKAAVCIEVRDTGMGIPAEHRDRIFEPFFTTKEGGTGLGLPIARQIVADHAGALTWESRPGLGTTFNLTLPVNPERATASPSQAS